MPVSLPSNIPQLIFAVFLATFACAHPPPALAKRLQFRNLTVNNFDPAIQYSPVANWAPLEGELDESPNVAVPKCTLSETLTEYVGAGGNITYRFQGSQIDIHAVSSTYGGIFSVSIDNATAQVYDSYDPSADPPQCRIQTAAGSLDPSVNHTILIQTLGQSPKTLPKDMGSGIGQFDFDAFVVTITSSSSRRWNKSASGFPIALGLILFVATTVLGVAYV